MANITGTRRSDELNGRIDADRILGLAGDDYINGERFISSERRDVTRVAENDRIEGGRGSDSVYGDGGVYSAFNAALEGGDDRIIGGTGRDYLAGDGDVVEGGDTARLVGGDDTIDGGGGRDTIVGDGYVSARDEATLIGGNDRLTGGKGDDRLTGDGDASAWDENATSSLVSGFDTFVFRKGYDFDTITDFQQGRDVIEMHGYRWSRLDTNDDGLVTEEDRRVSESDGLEIDLGNGDGLLVMNVESMTQEDFFFA